MQQFPQFSTRLWIWSAPRWERKFLARLCLSSHRLLVETGRWQRWPRPFRVCRTCVRPECVPQCTCEDQRCVADEQHFCWGCWNTLHLWDRLVVLFRDQLNVALGPTLCASLHSLGELKRRELREASRHINQWARDVLKIGQSQRMTYNSLGAFVADEDHSSSASMFDTASGSA